MSLGTWKVIDLKLLEKTLQEVKKTWKLFNSWIQNKNRFLYCVLYAVYIWIYFIKIYTIFMERMSWFT